MLLEQLQTFRLAAFPVQGVCTGKLQNKLPKRHRKYFKKSRHLLMKPMEKLTDDEMHQLALMFEIAPRLADAYRIKNDFLSVIRSKSADEGKKAIADWLFSVEVIDLPEFHDCTKAYHN